MQKFVSPMFKKVPYVYNLFRRLNYLHNTIIFLHNVSVCLHIFVRVLIKTTYEDNTYTRYVYLKKAQNPSEADTADLLQMVYMHRTFSFLSSEREGVLPDLLCMLGEVWLVQFGDLNVVYSKKLYLCLSAAEMCRCWKSEGLSLAMYQVYTLRKKEHS